MPVDMIPPPYRVNVHVCTAAIRFNANTYPHWCASTLPAAGGRTFPAVAARSQVMAKVKSVSGAVSQLSVSIPWAYQ